MTDIIDNACFLGIDPGKQGGWGIVTQTGKILSCGKRADWQSLKLLVPLITGATIEREGVWAGDMRVKGKIFRVAALVQDFGWWQGILDAWGIPWKDVAPRTWRAYYGLSGKTPRHGSALEAAHALWPELSNLLKQHHDGIAVGLLLARYGLLKEE